jgi:SAM-dependent methyltransferase
MAMRYFGPEAWTPLAEALSAYAGGDQEAVLTVHSDAGDPDPMPVSLFFRRGDDLREIDRQALERVRGRVLDAGAGVGSISLTLQELGFQVTAVEVIPEAMEIMVARGVRDARPGRVEELPPSRDFDTVLLLMNGAALAGTLAALPAFLEALDGLLAPGGQVLLDSTNLLEETGAFSAWEEGEYPGEIHYQMEFRGKRGVPFPQLFLDPGLLAEVASGTGFRAEVLWRGASGEYLARLTRAEDPSLEWA